MNQGQIFLDRNNSHNDPVDKSLYRMFTSCPGNVPYHGSINLIDNNICSYMVKSSGSSIPCMKLSRTGCNYYFLLHSAHYKRGKVLTQINTKETFCSTGVSHYESTMDSVCIYYEDTKEIDVFVTNKVQEAMDFSIILNRFQKIELIEHLCIPGYASKESNNSKLQSKGKRIRGFLRGYSRNLIRIREVC